MARPSRVFFSHFLCSGVPKIEIAPVPNPLHGEGEVGEAVVAGERLAREAKRANVERSTALRIDRRVLQPSIAAEAIDEVAARGVHICVVNRQIRAAPRFQRFVKRPVAVFEERPGEEAFVRHQSPSNTGFSFATKAR